MGIVKGTIMHKKANKEKKERILLIQKIKKGKKVVVEAGVVVKQTNKSMIL